MGEDNISIGTIYYNGQPIGYVDGLGHSEDPMKDIDKYLLLNDYQKVVRCKDCKFAVNLEFDEVVFTGKWCCHFHRLVSFMGFCAWGESR